MKNYVPEHPEKILKFLGKDVHSQKISVKSAEQSNLKSHTHNNSNIFELQSNETSFCGPNNAFSGIYQLTFMFFVDAYMCPVEDLLIAIYPEII